MNKWLVIGMVLFSSFIISLGLYLSTKEKNSSELEQKTEKKKDDLEGIIDYTDAEDTKEKVDSISSLSLSVIGENSFQETKATIETISWEDTPSHRFILVPMTENIDEGKQEKMQKWIKENKVVLFYGDKVNPNVVKDRIGLDFDVFEFKGNVDVTYMLYGYGYSEKEKKKMPLFLGSNSTESYHQKILTFLSTHLPF
jgi:hypothetical protein